MMRKAGGGPGRRVLLHGGTRWTFSSIDVAQQKGTNLALPKWDKPNAYSFPCNHVCKVYGKVDQIQSNSDSRHLFTCVQLDGGKIFSEKSTCSVTSSDEGTNLCHPPTQPDGSLLSLLVSAGFNGFSHLSLRSYQRRAGIIHGCYLVRLMWVPGI